MTSIPKTQPCPKCDGNKYSVTNKRGFLKASLCKCFHCEKCDGGGRIYEENEKGISSVRNCECSRFKKRVAMLNEAGIPGKFLNSTFDGPTGYSAIKRPSLELAKTKAKDYVEDFGKSNRGLVFMGGPGLGKTHLVVVVIKALILEKGVDCKFVDFFQLLSDIRHGYSHDLSDQEMIDPYVKSRVLVIDELAKGRNTEWELTILDQIISNRYNAADKITLFTTNYPIDLPREKRKKQNGSTINTGSQSFVDMFTRETLQDRIGPRIFSRLAEICDFIQLEGEDHRHVHTRVYPPPKTVK